MMISSSIRGRSSNTSLFLLSIICLLIQEAGLFSYSSQLVICHYPQVIYAITTNTTALKHMEMLSDN